MASAMPQRPSQEVRLRRWRAIGLAAFAGAFALWQLADIFVPFRGRGSGWLAALPLLGALVLASIVIRVLFLQRAIARDHEVRGALNDELVRHHRARSLVAGFWAVMIAQGAFLVAHAFGAEVTAVVAARLTILVGVVAVLSTFAMLERD
jgi:hypothetical protein